MQPTYMPWAGYFNLIQQVDTFVFLDDVQFEGRSWQSRNRILLSGKPHWLSVPVVHQSQSQKISETKIDDSQRWRIKQQRLLQQNYLKHPFGKLLEPVIEIVGNGELTLLADFNIAIVQEVCRIIGLQTKCIRSGSLNLEGKRSQKLIAICENLGCDSYLSPRGSAEYLAEDKFTEETKVQLEFQEFEPKVYPQLGAGSDFVSHLSILDVVAHLGSEATLKYVQGK